jgi:hypothetical protein
LIRKYSLLPSDSAAGLLGAGLEGAWSAYGRAQSDRAHADIPRPHWWDLVVAI